MYTIEDLARKVNVSEKDIIDWLKRNGKFIGENGYSDEILNELIDEFDKHPFYNPISKNDDGPDFDI